MDLTACTNKFDSVLYFNTTPGLFNNFYYTIIATGTAVPGVQSLYIK